MHDSPCKARVAIHKLQGGYMTTPFDARLAIHLLQRACITTILKHAWLSTHYSANMIIYLKQARLSTRFSARA